MKYRAGILALVAALGLLSTVDLRAQRSNPQPSPSAGGAQEYVVLGKTYREAKDYDRAIEAYRRAIALEPSVDGGYSGLVLTYLQSQRLENALAAAREYVRVAPNSAYAHYFLGTSHSRLRQYQSAILAYREALRLQPELKEAHGGLGLAYHHLEDYSQAAAAFQQAIRLAPDNPGYRYRLGMAYVEIGRKEDVLQVLPALQRLDPELATKLSEELELFPDSEDPFLVLDAAFAFLEEAEHTLALRLFRRAIVLNPDPELVGWAYRGIGYTYDDLQKHEQAAAAYQQAVVAYQRAIRRSPDEADLHAELGHTYVELGKRQEALQALRVLQRLDREQARKLQAAIDEMP